MASQEKQGNVDNSTIPPESPGQKIAETNKKFWHIDKEMIRFKMHFFLFEAALGTSLPYITIFAKNRIGISASSLAVILITQQFLFIFTKPALGYIADYFNKLKAIICILSIVQPVFFLLLLVIPKIETEERGMTDSNNTFFLLSDGSVNISQLYMNCAVKEDANSFPSVSDSNNLKSNNFCFLSIDHLSNDSDECSYQDVKTKNISDILTINNSTENSLLLTGSLNSSFLSNAFYPDLMSTCRICCKFIRKCQQIECEIPKKISEEVTSKTKTVRDFERYQFWLYALLTTISMGCTNGLFTLSDTACCESVAKTGAEFGRQRLYGAMGWGLMSPIGGLLNDYTNDYTASWILTAVLTFLSLLNILRLDLVKPKFSKNLLKDVGAVLKSKEFLAFKLSVFFNGIGTGVIWFYLVWYLTTIGGSRFLCGMVQFVECFIGEIPFMFFSGWVINKIGHFNVLTLSLLSYFIRFFWYSRLINPWLVLPVEVLHGFTYGIFYTTVASYAKLSAKPGTEATTQSLLFTAHEGLGAGIGCVVAGLGFDHLGGQSTFFFLSIFASCCMIINIIMHFCIRGRKRSVDVTPS